MSDISKKYYETTDRKWELPPQLFRKAAYEMYMERGGGREKGEREREGREKGEREGRGWLKGIWA